jgi:hypothetical protein
MEKRIKYGTILLTFLITSLLIYGYFYHVSGDSPVPVKADMHMSAKELIGLADKDEALFDRQCLNKILSVGGIVKEIKRSRSGNYILSLELSPATPSAGTEADSSFFINCSFDSLYDRSSLSLKPGDSCSIRGACAGHLANIILLQCIIEK